MPHRDAQIIPIANFTGGTNQAPGFLRQARGAAEEMENLVLDLQGRPVRRKGYTTVSQSVLPIGTTAADYTVGDQLVVVHWLGDSSEPDGVKRAYQLPRHASWVQDENGRLLFVVAPDTTPYFIDVKENVRYEWDLSRIDFPVFIDFTTIYHGDRELQQLSDQRNENAMRLGNVEDVPSFRERIEDTTPTGYSPMYVVAQLATDIGEIEIAITQRDEFLGFDAIARDDTEVTLYSGPIKQGSYMWYWDSRDAEGNPIEVEGETYKLVGKIHETDIEERRIAGEEDEKVAELDITWDPDDVLPEHFTILKQRRFTCLTYVNPELNIESRPSPIRELPVYDVLENSRNRDIEFAMGIGTDHNVWENAPDWATHVYVYASTETVPIDHELEGKEASEVGVDFRRIAEFQRTTESLRAKAVSDGELLDSYEHDGPIDELHVIGAYGVGLWGAANNRVYFNKIGNQGEQRLYALPSTNALVPHSFPLSKSGQSPILHIHPAAHESALLAFKRDAIHIIKGQGVISGLYNPDVVVQVDIDASSVIVGTGSASPRSILTVGSGVYFVGSDRRFYQYAPDWRGNARLRDVGLPIQKYLNEIAEDDLPNIVAFLYQNCYHLITPERVIIMDMTRNYWTSASWVIDDAIWSRGGKESESILYALRSDDSVIELYSGDTDGDDDIGAAWQSNPLVIPSESVLTGVMCVHTTSPAPEIRCRIDVDDNEGTARDFTPSKHNDFRCGTHALGSRVKVRLESDGAFPLMDRINAEVFIAR